jgi:hypothetical protein
VVGNNGVRSKLLDEFVGEKKLKKEVLQVVETQM